ncbi:PREDICTED: zinc finger protein 91-like [Dufourea novaeangliae]|uniref:zinc finger protein 91-like n=1 Tax=Dufourea novaeangliae TaxID=178035 RepID=UPI000767D94D|nr:PREDICTED: zinc finger protein 91-like [Dufourea novaeangliae]
MSGRLPRLRALRPRPQQTKIESQKEGNLKEDRQEVTMTEQESRSDSEEVSLDDKDDDDSAKDSSKDDHDGLVDSQGYECKTCKPPKPLPSLKAYLDHLKKEHKQKGKYVRDAANRCSMCSYVALNSRDLETHQRVHHLKRRFFRCAKCSYVTHVRARYTKHVKYHSMPMIKCDACDFRTPYKWNLDRHTRNHGGGGAFQCRACNFTADIRQSLTVHETNHHEPPVGQTNRKSNAPFERKPRNSPKRYNQVGASDFRDTLHISGNTTVSLSPGDSFMSDQSMNSMEDKRSAIANAECIALKCEEKGCQFITAWDSEMQRHLAECHAPVTPNKSRKPLPMLIPLSPTKPNSTSGSSTTLLKVPRVRVRPELAQIARDTELARLYGNKEVNNLKKDANNAADLFEKKNASFFDKLKEKLTTSASINNGVPEVAVSTTNDLKCWCTFKASSMEELACHKQTHHTALSVSVGTTRCPKCRRRCKSSTDLQAHMQCCRSTSNDASIDSSLEKLSNCSELRVTSYRGEYAFPGQTDWDVNLSGLNSSGSSVEGTSTHPSGRRVFKCPHCPFWASTASRFHVHIVGHLNRKPFECSLCAYRSNWRWDITKHIKLKAAKDPVHLTARVLMTDETGRRNYSKYNKYLAQVEQQSWDEQNMEERSVEESNSDEPPTKLLIMNSNEYMQSPEFTSTPVSIVSTSEGNNVNTINIGLRPPPPLKAASRNRGQSLLKNNLISPQGQSSSASATLIEDNKRTMWKCKRCNFRHSNRETVSLHVKSHNESEQHHDDEKNPFGCGDCPFSAPDAATLSMHRVHHRPNLEAIFKCYLCPYYVSTKAELLDHVRLHGEELAVVHQQSTDYNFSPVKYKTQQANATNNTGRSKQEKSVEQVIHITTQNNVTCVSNALKNSNAPPPLLLDTRALPEAPLVWVSKLDGTLAKMLKCRHCPFVSSRRAEVRDHETMHLDSPSQGPVIACTDCSFTCTRREIMVAHTDMHSGSLGTVHCLVDDTRPDSQQLSDLATLLGFTHSPVLGSEPDLRDSRLVHCCSKCPARFLCEKELRIHLRYHSTELAYSCQWCSYAARQPAHLLAHQKAHSTEYQERTKYLLSLYGYSQRYPPPTTACVEAGTQDSSNSTSTTVAWIVVEVSEPSSSNYNNSNQRTGNQVFTCAKCPARYFKLDALEYHMTLHGSNNRFKCTECDYSSKTAQNLVKHQVVHRRQTETSEIITNLSTTSDPQFGLYMRGNPNFVYPGYLRNGRLKEKRYKCHKCPSAFEKREQYKVHLTLHGAKQRYRCDTCDYSVKYYANYVQHLKKHQANAEAQASRRQFEDDTITIDSDTISDSIPLSRSGKTLKSSNSGMAMLSMNGTSMLNYGGMQASNQDKQSMILLQRKGLLLPPIEETETLRCQSCPFSTSDKDALDSHKRRHGIERMTPSCPHCDYIPRKDENIGEHIRLHFTRLYKPESYLIIELLTLTMKKIANNGKEEKQKTAELLFKEYQDGRFFPLNDTNSFGSTSTVNNCKEKVIVDPNTGETKHLTV